MTERQITEEQFTTSDGRKHPRASDHKRDEIAIGEAFDRRTHEEVVAFFDAHRAAFTVDGPPETSFAVAERTAAGDNEIRRRTLAQIDAAVETLKTPMAPPAPDYQPLSAQAKADIAYTALCFRAEGPPPTFRDMRMRKEASGVRAMRHYFNTQGVYRGVAMSFPPPPPGVFIEDILSMHVAIPDRWAPDEFPDLGLIYWSLGPYALRYDGPPPEDASPEPVRSLLQRLVGFGA